MAKLTETFNADEVEIVSFENLPPGPQNMMVTASELQDTEKGGQMIVLEMTVMDGEFAGRKLFERLNIVNANEKAQQIAYSKLATLIKAIGKTTIKDTNELHNKRFVGVVAVDPPKPYTDKNGTQQPGRAQNKVTKFLPYGASTGSTPAVEESPKKVESPAAKDATAPWKRKQTQ